MGRCGHICNASYAVKKGKRGQGIGEALVRDSMKIGKELGFRILQFNAVAADNVSALALYKKLGSCSGDDSAGFLKTDGSYGDIIPHYILL